MAEPSPTAAAPHVEPVVPGPRESPWAWLATVALVILAWTLVRPDPYRELWLPIVADVLGHASIPYRGTHISAEHPWVVRLLLAAVFLPLLVGLRAILVHSRFRGLRWAARLRLDAPFLLALTPFLVLLPLWYTLEEATLFTFPWAFLFVAPISFVTMLVLFFVSLTLALWVEQGGPGRSLPRFGLVLLLFFVLEILFVRYMAATTADLRVWGYVLPPLVAYATFFGVTLGHRLLSHRRVLFALGAHHLTLAGVFLLRWVLDGPWPMMEWSWHGIAARRDVGEVRIWFGLALVLVPIGITTGLFTIGAYLQGYLRAVRPWRDGANVVLVFSQTLHAWVVTMLANDPYGALDHRSAAGGIVGMFLALMGGWGYLAAKVVGAVFLVFLVDSLWRDAPWLHGERRVFLKLLIIAAGLLPGLREATRLGIGV